MKIGELSRQTQCNVQTIRYYERIGLLPQPRRQGKYRCYECDDVARLKHLSVFVKSETPSLRIVKRAKAWW